jgi:cell division protein FtsA
MFGKTLELDLLVVSMDESAFNTLGHCIEQSHLSLESVVAAPFSSGLAALEDDEMELGAVCIDLGGGATSVAVFGGGSLRHVDSLPVGGIRVTNDIAVGLSTTVAGAERIKTLHGSAIASARDDREMIEAPHRGRRGGRRQPLRRPLDADRHHQPACRGDAGDGPRSPARRSRADRAGRGHRPDRGRQPAGGRARGRRPRVRPPRASGQAPPRALPRRRGQRPGVLRRRRRIAPRRLRPREAVSAKALAGARGPREPAEMPAGALGRAVVWLRENL